MFCIGGKTHEIRGKLLFWIGKDQKYCNDRKSPSV